MANIVVASTKKVNFFDKIIQSVVIAINVSKMNKAIDEHIDNLKEEMDREKQDELEKILREIIYVKYQYEIMQKTMYELKVPYGEEITEKINTVDKCERLEMIKTLLEMEYERISKTIFKSKEDIRYRLLTVSSVIDKIKQEIKDEGKNIKYNILIKCFEEIEGKIDSDEYTETMYDQLISYVNDYIAYINSNYDIARLPDDERELIEFVFEDAMNSNNSDLERYVHEYNLLINICKNSYSYYKVIDKIFEKIQGVYDESLKYKSINSKDYFTFFKEIFDTKIKTRFNDVKRTQEIEDDYMAYCKILMNPDELEEYIINRILETTSSVSTKKVFKDRLKELEKVKEEVKKDLLDDIELPKIKPAKKVGRKPKKAVLEDLEISPKMEKAIEKAEDNKERARRAEEATKKEELEEAVEEVKPKPRRRRTAVKKVEEAVEEKVEEKIEEIEEAPKPRRRAGAAKKSLGQFAKKKVEKETV